MSTCPDPKSLTPALPPSRTPSVPRSAVAGAILDCAGARARLAIMAVGTEKRLSVEQRNSAKSLAYGKPSHAKAGTCMRKLV